MSTGITMDEIIQALNGSKHKGQTIIVRKASIFAARNVLGE